MSQQMRLKLPGTLFVVDLTLDRVTNTGKVVLERKAVEATKSLSDLSLTSIQSVLLDLLDDQGLHPNPRIISRVLEDIEPAEATAETPISPVEETRPDLTATYEVTQVVPTPDIIVTSTPLLKVKDILAAANSQMSKLDNLIGSPGLPEEVGSTMQALQDLLKQAKNVINDALSS